MKKLIALTAALALCLGAASCGKKSGGKKEIPAAVSPVFSYNPAYIEMTDSFSRILSLDISQKSGQILIFGQLTSGTWGGFITDADFSDHEQFSFTPAENEIILGAASMGFGKTALLTSLNNSAAIHVIGADGTEEKSIQTDIHLDIGDSGNYSGNISPCTDGFVIRYGSDPAYLVSENGISEEISTDGADIFAVSVDGEGNTVMLLRDSDGEGRISSVNGDSTTDCGKLSSSALAMCRGMGKYSYIAVFTNGLYGLEGSEWVMLSDFSDTPFDALNILDIVMTEENEFAVLIWTDSGTELYLLSERDISALKSKKVIKIAAIPNSGNVPDMVFDYNETHKDGDYRMELVTYDYQPETGKNAAELLKSDIISGNAPDVITYPIDGIDFNGYYMNLFDFMENDPDISQEDFIPNILDSMSIDGKLPYIVPHLEIRTMMAKSKFPFVKENWSYNEFIAAYEAMPDGMSIIGNPEARSMEENFLSFVNIYDFIDYEKAECNFDSPQFAAMLDFVRDNKLGMTYDELVNYDPSLNAMNNYDPMALSEDKQLIAGTNISYFQDIWVQSSYFCDDVTFTGRPSLSGNGTFTIPSNYSTSLSIPKNAENPDGAWDFIKFYFSETGYQKHRLSFPIYQEHFDKTADHCLENKAGNENLAKLPDDGWVTAVRYTNAELTEYEILEPLTEEELQQYKEFVYTAAGNFVRTDEMTEYIIYDEITEFFNSSKSAEDTAAMIQNRISIYLSETYG